MDYKICNRCIIDTTVPGVRFSVNGECNFCDLHNKLDKNYPLNEVGKNKLDSILRSIKNSGIKKKYDCVIGISGGRDSTYLLYLAKKIWNLRPLAVHFNDGFGNPVAGENMYKAIEKLGIDLRTITSDWRESKDLKISFLKASTPDLEEGTDLGIASGLYGIAAKENIRYLLIGQSFRTEGIAPLAWNYLDGRYLKSVHAQFGSYPLRKWKPTDPGFNLDLFHMFYYAIIKRIRTITPLYYVNYVRKEAEEIIKKELDWVYPGAHYFDDLYQALMAYVLRVKFNIDRRKFNYSALIRSQQMHRDHALESIQSPYSIEDPKVIDLCIKRLGISNQEFEEFMKLPVKTFRDYSTNYSLIKSFRLPIKILSKLQLIPEVSYDKYFHCG